jgi:hypothetical protein
MKILPAGRFRHTLNASKKNHFQDYHQINYGVPMKLAAMTALGLGLICANAYAGTTNPPISTQGQPEVTATAQNQQQAFLDANKRKPGVVTLPDGLQYKVLVDGKGPKPSANDVVSVNYAGKLIDGTEFDSSYKRGEPATFPVGGVIPGWVEALQLMKVGSTWELYIPANLAYGEQGAPPVIGPNQTLIFKVELLDIKKS